MLGGVGVSENTNRELTDIEEALAKRVIERTIKTLEGAWQHVVPVQNKIVGLDNNFTMVQIVTPGEIVALVTLEVHVGGNHFGLISLCFPYPMLENILAQLRADTEFAIEKAMNHRGISAGLMNDVLTSWCIVLENGLEHTDYGWYGDKLIKEIDKMYGFGLVTEDTFDDDFYKDW